jgi:APA family basic amino acid/polyamine antiporter
LLLLHSLVFISSPPIGLQIPHQKQLSNQGMIIGAGVFVSTGAAANRLAGPAIILSFVVGGVSSLLSALCYAEFAAEHPTAAALLITSP